MHGLWGGERLLDSPDKLQLQMISFSLDPQWCGLLFSICSRHEKGGGVFGGDAFSVCSAAAPLDADWLAFAGSIGVEICHLSSSWALVLDTVKAGGVILLLGVGSLICYKLYHYYRPGSRSRFNSPNSTPPHSRQKDFIFYRVRDDNQLIEDLDDEDLSSIEGRYFGPSPAPSKNNLKHGLDVAAYLKKSNFFCNHCPSSSSSHSDSSDHGFTSLPVTPGKRSRHKTRGRKSIGNWEDGWKTASQGLSREERKPVYRESSPCSMPYLYGTSGNSGLLLSSQPHLPRDESFDSLGFSKRLPREGSFDSTCSELSFDFSLPEAPNETSTMACLDNLQQEIDQLKNNCLMMDEEFETIKCNRNLPGMSSLMTANVSNKNSPLDGKDQSPHDALQETLKLQNARACFAGLYSLTTIKNSTSSELSDSINGNGRASVGSAESLAWDSPIAFASPVKMPMDDIIEDNRNMPDIINSTSLNDLHSVAEPTVSQRYEDANKPLHSETGLLHVESDIATALEWDEEGLEEWAEIVGETELTDSFGFPNTGSQAKDIEKGAEERKAMEQNTMMESMMSTTSSVSERSMKTESGYESKLTDSTITNSSTQLYGKWDQYINNLSRSVSFESSSSQRTFNEMDPGKTGDVMNIGERFGLIEYAEREWRGNSHYAQTIKKAYSAIPSVLGTSYLRRIRGDNYCAIRAAIFQILANGLPIPSLDNMIDKLSTVFHENEYSWLQNWDFAGRLKYSHNVLFGMQACLEAIKRMITELTNYENKEEHLAQLLNLYPIWDLHIMEGVKLIMMMEAINLYKASSTGSDVPLFATLMFTRDTSETPRDFMNNHLKEVGNTGGMEQDRENIEMYLLGFAFQITLRVVRPSAYGREDFICCYPDSHVGQWPYVIVIADEDRHYNILVE